MTIDEDGAGRGAEMQSAPQGAGVAAVLGPELWRSLRLYLAVFLLLDLALMFGGSEIGIEMIYGFFSLILFPVMLCGVLGTLVPQLARAAQLGPVATSLALPAGLAFGVLLLIAGHVLAIWGLNAAAYGGEALRPVLLNVTALLASIYYLALATIAMVRPGRDAD